MIILCICVVYLLSISPGSAHLGKELETSLFPEILQGDWYSWENGQNVEVTILPSTVDSWGEPLVHFSRLDSHDYVFKQSSGCFICSRFIVRSWNILERVDSTCKTLNSTEDDLEVVGEKGCGSIFNLVFRERITRSLKVPKNTPQRGHVMYRQNPSPVNCRHSIYGSYKFAYQIKDSFTGECQSHKSRLHSCNTPGSQFFISNQKFLLDFSKCTGIKDSYDGSGEFSCLGEWREGLQQYFVAANLRESRKEERYRCFLTNREDPDYMGMSRSPSCKSLNTPANSPVRLRLTALQEEVAPSCFLPIDIKGKWVSSGMGEPFVEINSTHIIESRWLGHQLRRDINVCIQNKGERFLLAKVSEYGCQTEYVCWQILPRHHNVVRFRKGRTLIHNLFEVCDYGNFGNEQHWKYDTLIAEVPNPIECPFSGRFTFGQKGKHPLETRILGGITSSPLDSYPCTERLTDLAICDAERKNMIIDLDLCQTLNNDGHPIEIQSIADYRLQCVGFWKENLVSYLITHDPFDSVSRFRCWVYQRISLTELRLSQGLGSSCGLRQTHSSASIEEGASLALNLTLQERLYDQCPMYYDDGKNPWKPTESKLKIFTFNNAQQHLIKLPILFCLYSLNFLVIMLS